MQQPAIDLSGYCQIIDIDSIPRPHSVLPDDVWHVVDFGYECGILVHHVRIRGKVELVAWHQLRWVQPVTCAECGNYTDAEYCEVCGDYLWERLRQ